MTDLISSLNQRVTIEYPVRTSDGYGGASIAWTTLATVFAEVTPLLLSQTEHARGAQPFATAGYRVRLRTRTDVTAAMRLRWKTHVLTIHSLHEQGETLSLLAYEEGQ